MCRLLLLLRGDSGIALRSLHHHHLLLLLLLLIVTTPQRMRITRHTPRRTIPTHTGTTAVDTGSPRHGYGGSGEGSTGCGCGDCFSDGFVTGSTCSCCCGVARGGVVVCHGLMLAETSLDDGQFARQRLRYLLQQGMANGFQIQQSVWITSLSMPMDLGCRSGLCRWSAGGVAACGNLFNGLNWLM